MTDAHTLHDALWKHYKADRDRKEIELVVMREEVARLTAVNAELQKTAALPTGEAEPPEPETAAAPAKPRKRMN